MKKFLTTLLLFAASLVSAQTRTEAVQEIPNTFLSTNQFLIGVDLGPVTFTNLPTPVSDGRVIYCTNCQQQLPCIGAGTGALAVRSAGVWNCSLGTGSGGGTSAEFMVNGVDTLNQTVINYQSANGVTWSNPSAGNIQASISGIVVNPVASQNLIQPVGTVFNANVFEKTRYVDASWNWSQSPVADLSAAGSKTITLTPCPLGIDTSNNTNAPYFVRIATQGTPEVSPVTGGTCTSGATTGTIVVTTANTHSAGYTVTSSTSGIQEAINDACIGGSGNCAVELNPASGSTTNYTVYSTVYVKPNVGGGYKVHLLGNGAYLACLTRDVCVFNGSRGSNSVYNVIQGIRFSTTLNVDGTLITGVSASAGTYTVTVASTSNFVTGDRVSVDYLSPAQTQHTVAKITVSDGTHFTYVLGSATFSNTSPTWGWAGIENAALEDNSQGSVIRDIDFGGASGSQPSAPGFGYGIVIDNDQNAVIDHLTFSQGAVRCTSNFCGALVYSRGDAGNAGVLHMTDSDLTLGCNGNGILVQSGNSASIHDTVIQGFSQYGVRYDGGLQGMEVDNVYEEVGNCINPQYPGSLQAEAGVQGQQLTILSDAPIVGQNPLFANTGVNQRNYFIVPQSTGFGPGPILFAGYANTNNAGTVNVYWPQVSNDTSAGTITYDVLLTTGNNVSPYLGNATSLATALTGSCSAGICTFADTHAAGSAYTVLSQTWFPHLVFWPGSYIGTDTTNRNTSAGVGEQFKISRMATTGLSGYASSLGAKVPSAFILSCTTTQSTWSPSWVVCQNGPTAGSVALATIYQQIGGVGAPTANSKGRLNLGGGPLNYPLHLFTLFDSNFEKTKATASNRPSNDANDSFIGADQLGGVDLGAQTSFSVYIGNVGDNSLYKIRLTSNALQINSTTTFNDGTGATQFKGTFGTCTNPGDATHDTLCYDGSGDLAFNKKNTTNFRKVVPQDYTVATLPVSSIDPSQLAVVTDSLNTGCPLTGGGSVRLLVRWSGSTWECVSGGGTTVGTYTFATLPVAPSTGTPALVSDWTGTCPITTGSGSPGKYLLARWSGSQWDCVTPTTIIPYNFTSEAWDGTQILGSTGGYHFGTASAALTNTNGDTNVMFLFQGSVTGGASQIGFLDGGGLSYFEASWATNLSLPSNPNKKCVDIDYQGHLQFFSGDCLIDPTTTNGDQIVRSSGALNRVAIGSTGQVWTVVGGLPAWATFSSLTNPMTTTGDQIYSTNNSGTPGRIGIGSTGQVWTVVGGLPAWANATIGGTVNSGAACQLSYYATSSTAVSGLANTCGSDGVANPVLSITETSPTKEAIFVNLTTPSGNLATFQVGGVNKVFIDSAGILHTSAGQNIQAANGAVYQSATTNGNLDYSTGTDANSNQSGTATFRAGNVTGTGVFSAGTVRVQPGALTNAAPSGSAVEGKLILDGAVLLKGATVTNGNLGCIETTNTIRDCSSTANNHKFVGVIESTVGGSTYVQTGGTVTVNLDASSTFNSNDFVCVSTTGAAQGHMNGTTACPSYTDHVGYAVTSGTSQIAVTVLLVR